MINISQWVIEFQNKRYLAVINGDFGWTVEFDKSLKFWDKEQAEDALKAIVKTSTAGWALEGGVATKQDFALPGMYTDVTIDPVADTTTSESVE